MGFIDSLLKNISPKKRMALDKGGSHPYDCRCENCLEYWSIIGPDPDTGDYGPFSHDEIKDFKKGAK